MTHLDPEQRPRSDDYIERAGVGWTPVVFGIAFLVLLGLLMLGWPQRSDRPAITQRSDLPNTAPNAPTIPTPSPPKPQ